MDYEIKTIYVEVKVYTNKSDDSIFSAIKKGIYYGLDVKNIAPPKNVSVIQK